MTEFGAPSKKKSRTQGKQPWEIRIFGAPQRWISSPKNHQTIGEVGMRQATEVCLLLFCCIKDGILRLHSYVGVYLCFF